MVTSMVNASRGTMTKMLLPITTLALRSDDYAVFDSGVDGIDLSEGVIEMTRVLASGLWNMALTGYVQIERERLGEGKDFVDDAAWYLEFADSDDYDYREKVDKLQKRWEKLSSGGELVLTDFVLQGGKGGDELEGLEPPWVKTERVVDLIDTFITSVEDMELKHPGITKVLDMNDPLSVAFENTGILRRGSNRFFGLYDPTFREVFVAAGSVTGDRTFETNYQLNKDRGGDKQNWSVDVSVYGTTRHEFMHHIENGLGSGTSRRLASIVAGLPADAKIVSAYGDTTKDGERDFSEFFAESISAFTHPEYQPGTLPENIESALTEVLAHGGIVSDETVMWEDEIGWSDTAIRRNLGGSSTNLPLRALQDGATETMFNHAKALQKEAERLGRDEWASLVKDDWWRLEYSTSEWNAMETSIDKPNIGGDEVDNSATGMLRRRHGENYMQTHDKDGSFVSMLWDQFIDGVDPEAISARAKGGKIDTWSEAFSAFTHPNYQPGTLPAKIENFIDEVLSAEDSFDEETLVKAIKDRGDVRAERLKAYPEKYVTVDSGEDEVVASGEDEFIISTPPERDTKKVVDGDDGDDGDDFTVQLGFNTPFEEAVAWAQSRTSKLNPGAWYDLGADAYSRAFSVAHVTSQQVLDDVREWSERAHRDGLTFKQFQDELVPNLKDRGWWATPGESAVVELEDGTLRKRLNMSRLGIIYDTNIAVANSVGRWKNIEDNQDLWPYVQYDGIDDEMTRTTHRVLFGQVYSIGSPILETIAPPNGFRCRCSLTQIDDEELDEIVSTTGAVLDQLPNGAAPDLGWDHNPGKKGLLGGWEPDTPVPDLPGEVLAMIPDPRESDTPTTSVTPDSEPPMGEETLERYKEVWSTHADRAGEHLPYMFLMPPGDSFRGELESKYATMIMTSIVDEMYKLSRDFPGSTRLPDNVGDKPFERVTIVDRVIRENADSPAFKYEPGKGLEVESIHGEDSRIDSRNLRTPTPRYTPAVYLGEGVESVDPSVAGGVRYAVGHTLADRLREKDPDSLEQWKQVYNNHIVGTGKSISRLAESSPESAFAEVFSAITHPTYSPRPDIPMAVELFVKEVVNRGNLNEYEDKLKAATARGQQESRDDYPKSQETKLSASGKRLVELTPAQQRALYFGGEMGKVDYEDPLSTLSIADRDNSFAYGLAALSPIELERLSIGLADKFRRGEIPVHINLKPGNMPWHPVIDGLVEEGEVVNQFTLEARGQAATSGGTLAPQKGTARDEWEERLSGGALQESEGYAVIDEYERLTEELARERPIYGYLGINPYSPYMLGTHYGPLTLVVKPDTERMTITSSNSSAITEYEGHLSKASEGENMVLLQAAINDNSDDEIKRAIAEDDIESLRLVPPKGHYAETQIYGGVNIDTDVSRIVIDTGKLNDPETVERLQNRFPNIEFKFINWTNQIEGYDSLEEALEAEAREREEELEQIEADTRAREAREREEDE